MWHVAKTGNHQGLVVDDKGNNIAVTYEKEHATLMAAAPDLLEACKLARALLICSKNKQPIEDAIKKATEEA